MLNVYKTNNPPPKMECSKIQISKPKTKRKKTYKEQVENSTCLLVIIEKWIEMSRDKLQKIAPEAWLDLPFM